MINLKPRNIRPIYNESTTKKPVNQINIFQLLLVLTLLPQTTFAKQQAIQPREEPEPQSSIQMLLVGGKDAFFAGALNGTVGLSENWNINSFFNVSSIAKDKWLRAFGFGPEWIITEDHQLSATLSLADDDYDLTSFGKGLEYKFNIASLWDAQLRTEFDLSVESISYTSPTLGSASTIQSGYSVGISQELSRIISLGLSMSFYRTKDNSNTLEKDLSSHTYNAPIETGLPSGSEETAITPSLRLSPGDTHRLIFEVSRITNINQTEALLQPRLSWTHSLEKDLHIGLLTSTIITGQKITQWFAGLLLGFDF